MNFLRHEFRQIHSKIRNSISKAEKSREEDEWNEIKRSENYILEWCVEILGKSFVYLLTLM